jgi:hypothetical protein
VVSSSASDARRALSNPRCLYLLKFRPLANEIQLAVSGNADTVRGLHWECHICLRFELGNPAKEHPRVVQLAIPAKEIARLLQTSQPSKFTILPPALKLL